MSHEDNNKELHIVMFPWLAFGHMIPFLELSKCLAQRGHHISFVSTPRNIQRLPKIDPNLSPLITFVELSLPSNNHNLPDQAEATIDIPFDKVEYLKLAFDGLEATLTSFLETTTPDWIIYDFAPHWLPPIAAKLDVPCAYFCIFAASLLAFFGPPSLVLNGEDPRTKPEHYTVPPQWVPFPCNLAFRMHEIIKVFNSIGENVSGVSDMFRVASTVQGCDIVAVKTCTEFEPEWLNLVEKDLFRKPVIPVGMLPASPPPVKKQMEDKKWMEISEWLDKQREKRVVYVAFGSEATLTQEETTQLALGLELSELPFFWVLREPAPELPVGFEERTRGRGLIWREWAPQVWILGHPSVGGFLSHCGWGSVVESLGSGCPLVLFPVMNDQPLVARSLQWKKMGLEIPRDENDGSFDKELVAKMLKTVVVDDEGQLYRANAKAMKEVFSDKDRNDQYVDHFAKYLQGHTRKSPSKIQPSVN